MKSTCILAAVMLLFLLASPSEAVITCSDVITDLRPCISYLVNGSGKPPPACCSGVSALASAASTSADRKTACECIKSASQKVNVNFQLAQALPGNCGIKLPFTVSPNVDCSKIS
ncbi:Non-specific lipid-transfer protein [Quillaja saponaria]|uniref:Non-specific lipid-transfer protein n=1 Tax=Quillaja saponaria TaxID=32244 RepID=A0AAD7QIS5_QUISA|nr:Non-specific lipid-transfer protein [Quillaja saponaria]